MKTLKFSCRLLSDVILNQKAATEGPNSTLDFIPGSCFLGIAAKHYDDFGDKALEIFHSGKVRFGDAHPSISNTRSLKVPANMFHPKLDSDHSEYYINPDDSSFLSKQLKQCRQGFYDFSNTNALLVNTPTSFSIKSAYNRDLRRSEDEKMFGYQSLRRGMTFLFSVNIDNDSLSSDIESSLNGIHQIGRSRTAQYGLVLIEPFDFNEIPSQPSQHEVSIYADGRLIFMDDYGLPTFCPKPSDLGIDDPHAEILWHKSQIRTFQYAPWNYKRQSFDTDRCGIEKGSVIVLKSESCPSQSQYVGRYINEGFGKVIYNPAFLNADPNGRAMFTLCKDNNDHINANQDNTSNPSSTLQSPLIGFLLQQSVKEKQELNTYESVNDWIDKHKSLFKGKEKFASQWGAIRSIAMSTDNAKDIQSKICHYIDHGIKKDDWQGKRLLALEQFMKTENNSEQLRARIVNLASEMAKICRKEKQQ